MYGCYPLRDKLDVSKFDDRSNYLDMYLNINTVMNLYFS